MPKFHRPPYALRCLTVLTSRLDPFDRLQRRIHDAVRPRTPRLERVYRIAIPARAWRDAEMRPQPIPYRSLQAYRYSLFQRPFWAHRAYDRLDRHCPPELFVKLYGKLFNRVMPRLLCPSRTPTRSFDHQRWVNSPLDPQRLPPRALRQRRLT